MKSFLIGMKVRLIIGALLPGLFMSTFVFIMELLQKDRFVVHASGCGVTFITPIEFFIEKLVFWYIYIGIQSIIYSFVMEFLVLRPIKRKILVIFMSGLLCFSFPIPLFFLFHIIGIGERWKMLELLFCSFICSGIGAIVGYILYSMYQQQLIADQNR